MDLQPANNIPRQRALLLILSLAEAAVGALETNASSSISEDSKEGPIKEGIGVVACNTMAVGALEVEEVTIGAQGGPPPPL